MDTKMNWADLPILLAVVEAGSLSGAARNMRVSQPTVSRRIQALEEQMGGALLRKTSSGLAPTAIGIKVLEHVRKMDHEAHAITRSTAAQDHGLHGSVTISASQGLGDMWLPIALRSFHEANPEIQLIVDVNVEQVNLARREADIALRWRGPGTQNSLIGRKVISVGFGLYAATSYLDKVEPPKTLEDLGTHAAIAMRFGEDSPFWPISLSEISTPPERTAFYSNNYLTHNAAITAGYGIGKLAHIHASGLQGVERVLPDHETVQDLWIVTHDDLSRTRRIRLVFDYLIKALTDDHQYFRSGGGAPWPSFQ